MALTFPLSLEQFLGPLRIQLADLEPTDNLITSRTRGGEQLTAAAGNVLWRGTAELTDYYHADADAIRAKLAILRRPGASFFLSPLHRDGPIADPEGAILGAAAPVIHSIAANNCEMRISGLPPDYVISDGDYWSSAYGSPARYVMHQVVTGSVANGGGLTGWIEVTPHILPGVQVGSPVTLVRPRFKAVLVAPPKYGSLRPLFTGGMGFEFAQTLSG